MRLPNQSREAVELWDYDLYRSCLCVFVSFRSREAVEFWDYDLYGSCLLCHSGLNNCECGARSVMVLHDSYVCCFNLLM